MRQEERVAGGQELDNSGSMFCRPRLLLQSIKGRLSRTLTRASSENTAGTSGGSFVSLI